MEQNLKTHLEEFFKKYDQDQAFVVDGTRVFAEAGIANQTLKRLGLAKDKLKVVKRAEIVKMEVVKPTKEEQAQADQYKKLEAEYLKATGKPVPTTWTIEDLTAELALVPELEKLGVKIKEEIGELDLVGLHDKVKSAGEKVKEPTVAELKAKLDELGVEYNKKATKAELEEILKSIPPVPDEDGSE